MKINKKKTKVMLFNPPRRSIDFFPEISLKNRILDVVPYLRLVSVTLTDNLTWVKNTDNIVSRAYAKIWMLRRLKALGASQRSLLEIYTKLI